ncbi:FAD-binding oxidoreductase [Sinomonas halotolerans]|uniref:FAD-linked oxidase C-terminal domain-containing protein n=1 Tax=Sinomonas halotolerans TaxID=1644133 RepID=A0ABU9WZJ9_9MICC
MTVHTPAPAVGTAPAEGPILMAAEGTAAFESHPRATTDPAARAAASTDRSGYEPATVPDAVVHAESADDVVAALRLAHEHRIPVVPRGAGTGLAGGASAHAGEVVVDVSRMNRILSIDPVEMIAVVEPGVLNAEVNAAAAEHGLFYAPDPASTAICSIGGNIATNAGGMWCAKYGVTRESVLGLRVVLPDGRIVSTGRRTIKGVTGYDLNALFIGSEGTLGIVVEATLRLRPRPVRTETLAAYFDDVEAAGRAASAITAARIQPSILELMDGPTLDAVDRAEGTHHRALGGAFLLAQTDGYGAHLELDAIAEAIAPFATSVHRAADTAEAEALVKARRDAIPSLEQLGRVSIGDIAVPRDRLAEAFKGLEEIAARTGVRIFSVAHAADGNLHPMIVVDPSESITEGPAKAALGEMFRLAKRVGGTLTGEHGVGLLKREWVREELGDTSLELQRAIRDVFDPEHILNRGKAL